MKKSKDYGINEEEVLDEEILKFKDKTPVLIFVMLLPCSIWGETYLFSLVQAYVRS